MMHRARHMALAVCFALAFSAQAAKGATDPPPAGTAVGDATALYNAGTIALERGAVGPSVTFLLAAVRLEPRAADVRTNLANALVAAAHAAGDEERSDDAAPIPLAAGEAWWLAAVVLAIGAMLGIAHAIVGLSWPARWIGNGLMIAGIALSTWTHYAAWEESAHPEAVVIAPTLSVERGPEEPSRPAVLLSAGERVRLGVERAGRVEVRLGSVRIGWAAREGLWRVADAPRYTSEFRPQ